MHKTIRLAPLTYTWQGGKYADVKRDGEANAHAVIEVDPPTMASFYLAVANHNSPPRHPDFRIVETASPRRAA